ncbi:MAG: redoxin family protein [Gemmataceae bacterium]
MVRRTPLLAVLASLLPSVAIADDLATDKINKRIDRLPAVDLAGKPVDLAVLAGGRPLVVTFLSFDCPVSNSYAAPLTELAARYAGQGVAFVGVVPTDEPLDAVTKRVAEFKLGFPVYADPKLDAVSAVKATTVPEAFVLDRNRVLRYRGRIDNAYSARLKRNPAVTEHDLQAALDNLLAGKDVKTPVTKPIGCPAGRREPSGSGAATVTFHKDVLPVLQANCQGCHRPGQVGPFPLLTYKHAVNWADDIKEYTQSRKMPPWKPTGGPPHGFVNSRRMSDKDLATLTAWVDAGCPEGDPKAAPPPVTFADEWQLGPPDLILTAPEEYHVGPAGKDVFRCFVLPTGLTEDKYIVGYEVKPGNPRVVHHTLNFWDATGRARQKESEAKKLARSTDQDYGPGYSVAMGIGFVPTPLGDRPGVPPVGLIGGWAPGQLAASLPPGAGYFIPKGADFVVQTHYHRTGKPETDRIRIGLYFAKKPVEKVFQVLTVGGMSPLNVIPAGKPDYTAGGAVWITQDATVYSVVPHMHLIGRAIKVTMTPPGGETVTLIDIPDWDYNWQETYWFKRPIKAKAGTKFEVSAVYDNSARNPNNPSSPPRAVFFGEETTNEMLFGFIGVTPDGPNRVRISRTDPAKAAPKKADGGR